MTASGNILLTGDGFLGVHPDLDPETTKEVEEFLGIPATRLTLGGIKTVGMAGVATSNAVLVHARATAQEIALVEEVSKLPVGRGSVNMGSGLIGTGLVINETGYLAGFPTSGYELGRIEEVFGFME